MATIHVKVAPGREVPLHRTTIAAPGGGHSKLVGDDIFEVADTSDVRRKIRSGDLIIATPPAPAAKEK